MIQDERSHGIVLECLLEDPAAGHRALPLVVSVTQRHDDLWSIGNDVLQRDRLGRLAAGLHETEDVRYDGLGVLTCFERQPVHILGEQTEKIFGDEEVAELQDVFRVDFHLWRSLKHDFHRGEVA